MRTALRTSAIAGVALLGAGLASVSPHAPTPNDLPVVSPAVQLTSADLGGLLNIPMNLLYAVINAPANELNAIDELSHALWFSGPWLVPGTTNIWGVDVGDPPKIEALTNMLFPFPAFSKPLGEQIAGLMAAELPTNTSCDTIYLCFFEGFDGLSQGYFKVPLSELLAGYTFPEDGPTVTDPHGAVPDVDGYEGTHVGPDGSDVYPWAGTTFTFDPSKPFEEFFNSLTAAPPTDPLTAFPNVFDVVRDVATALYVMFNPLLPGGPYTPSFVPDDGASEILDPGGIGEAPDPAAAIDLDGTTDGLNALLAGL